MVGTYVNYVLCTTSKAIKMTIQIDFKLNCLYNIMKDQLIMEMYI